MGHSDSSARLSGSRAVHNSGDGIGVADPPIYGARLNLCDPAVALAAEESASMHRTSAARWLLLFLVRVYRGFFSPFFGAACKFHPSCSQYAFEAIERWGARRGAWLASKRLGRCRPFSRGGYDPVPELPADQNSAAGVPVGKTAEVTR